MPAAAVVENYRATIDNAQEQAANNCLAGSTARGTGTMTFDTGTNSFSWNIAFGNNAPDYNNGSLDQGSETGAHFHIGAPGVNGGVTIALPLGSPKVGNQVLNATQKTSLQAGNFYVNIHSSSCGAGEIRGQVLLQEVPLLPAWAWLLGAGAMVGAFWVLRRVGWVPRRA